jgi:hypothetical protein
MIYGAGSTSRVVSAHSLLGHWLWWNFTTRLTTRVGAPDPTWRT